MINVEIVVVIRVERAAIIPTQGRGLEDMVFVAHYVARLLGQDMPVLSKITGAIKFNRCRLGCDK